MLLRPARPFVTHNIARVARPSVIVLSLLATACGSGSHSPPLSATQTSTSTANASGTVHIVMRSLYFTPTTVDAKVGQRVVWTNEDSSPHNVTYVSGPRFRSSRPVMRPGAKFSLRLRQSGTIHYFCTLHPWMKATIVVSA